MGLMGRDIGIVVVSFVDVIVVLLLLLLLLLELFTHINDVCSSFLLFGNDK